MDLLLQMNPEGADLFYDPDFRSVIEDHLTLLKNDPATIRVAVDNGDIVKFRGDLFGYLTKMDVPLELHWITMRVNGWFKETEFDGFSEILIPNENSLKKIKQMYEAVNTKK